MTSESPGSDPDPTDHEVRRTLVLKLVTLPPPPSPRFEIEHPYFELVYEPLIGPSAFVVARNLVRHLRADGERVSVCPLELALEAGLRASRVEPLGRNAPLSRTLQRLRRFDLVRLQGEEVGVRLAVAPVPDRWRRQLPPSAASAHQQFLADLPRGGSSR